MTATVGGRPRVLVASGLGERTGGGMALLADGRVNPVDRLSTCGVAWNGDRFVRAMFADGLAGRSTRGELLVYDRDGLERYLRIDGVSDIHDVAWDGDEIVLVSTGSNEIVWVDAAGRPLRRWKAQGDNDAWHLNCLAHHDGRWYATAFCRSPDHRAWFSALERQHGVLFELESGEAVVEGLSFPHTPRWIDGSWVVADSARKRIAGFDPRGCQTKEADVGGWSRGIVCSDSHLYVGVSAPRGSDAGQLAEIVVLDRRSWEIEERLALPWQEVYDVALVSPEMAEGLRRGWDTNPLRVAEASREPDRPGAPLWGEITAPDPSRLHAEIDAELPAMMTVGETIELPVVLRNTGEAPLATAPPAPVELTYNWRVPATREWLLRDERSPVQSVRTRIPEPLAPGEEVRATLRVEAPYRPGDWLLTLTLLDERIGWFDEFERPSGNSRIVSVEPAPSPPQQPEHVRLSPLLDRLRRRPARRSAPVAP